MNIDPEQSDDGILWHTAVHEAGHAVIGRILNLPCGKATIVPDFDEETNGFALVTREPDTNRAHWYDHHDKWRGLEVVFHANILVSMAGAEAERVVIGCDYGGDSDDETNISWMGASMMDTLSPERDRLLAQLRRHTSRLVRKHRLRIERVAFALMEHRTLQGHEIDELVSSPIE